MKTNLTRRISLTVATALLLCLTACTNSHVQTVAPSDAQPVETSAADRMETAESGQNICPVRTINYVRNNRILPGHVQAVQYIASITV